MFSKIFIIVGLVIVAGLAAAHGQEDESRLNFNIGGSVGVPVGRTSDIVRTGGGIQAGAGINFNPLVGVNGEYMYAELPIKRSVLNALNAPGGSSRVQALTGNLILRAPTTGRLGFYGIGGGGWYRRTSELTEPGLVPGAICTPLFDYWVECIRGQIRVNVVTASRTRDAFGGNIGAGVTVRVGEGNMKFFTEPRYHYAPHGGVATKLLPVRFGLRW